MSLNKAVILILILFLSNKLFADSYELTLTSSKDIYFKDSTKLTATNKFKGGWYKIKLDGKYGDKFGVISPTSRSTESKSKTVTESGTYHAYLYKEQIGWQWKKVEHCSITVIKDSTSPTISPSANEDWTSGNVTVYANAKDDGSGLDYVKYKIDSGSYKIGSSVTVSKNSTITFYAMDNVTNNRTKTYTVNNIDSDKPTFNLVPDISNSSKTIGPVKLILNGIVAKSGVKQIEFKNDGGSWVVTDTKTITSNSTVYCRILNEAGSYSDIKSYTVSNIDKTPPNIVFSSSNTDWTNGNVTVKATAIDDESGIAVGYPKLKNSSGLYKEFTSVEVSKNQTLNFIVKNSAGITSYFDYIVDNIDKTPPIISISTSTKGWTSEAKEVTVSAIDSESGISSKYYSFDNISWNEDNSVTVSDNKIIYFKVKNGAGSWVYDSFTVNNIDKSPPIISISTYPTSWTYDSIKVIAVSNDPESGIVQNQYSRDNITWFDGSIITVTDNGPLYFRSKNSAGLYSTNSYLVDKIDKTPPVISVNTDIMDDEWSNEQVTVTAICLDDESSIKDIKYSYDNLLWITGDSVDIFKNSTLYFKVENRAGSKTSTSYTVHNIDKTPPEISFSINPIGVTNQDVEISVVAEDKDSGIDYVQYQKIDGSWVIGSRMSVSNNSEVTFKALNKAGSWSDPMTFHIDTIDKTAPIILNPFINNQKIFTNRLYLQAQHLFAVDDNLSSVEYSLDGNLFYIFNNEIDVTNLSDGYYHLYLKVTDSAGNITASHFEFLKDSIVPIVKSFDLQFNNTITDTMGNSTLSIENLIIDEKNLDSYSYQIRNIESGEVINEEFSGLIGSKKTINLKLLSDGLYEISIISKDIAGNIGRKSESFFIDRTAPSVDGLLLELDQYGNDDVVSFSGINMKYSYGDSSILSPRYQYYISKKPPGNVGDIKNSTTLYFDDSKIDFLEGNGLYYIYSFIIDDAGNISEDYAFRTIRYNNSSVPIPVISGVKKAETLTDIIGYNDLRFKLSPQRTDIYGNIIEYGDLKIIGYSFKLFKGYFTDSNNSLALYEGEITSSEDIYTFLDFQQLPDNSEGEYYTLFVKAKSNTERYSDFTNKYQFRIDTTPPEFLEIRSSSHKKSDVEYSYNYVNFFWDDPWDMSGVKEYKYSISFDGNDFIEGDISNVISSGNRHFLNIPLKDEFIKGSMFLHVEAVDFAGNINSDNSNTLHVKVNRVIPIVDILSINNNPEELKTTVHWDISGDIQSQKVVIEKNEYERTAILPGNQTSFTFDGLLSDENYKVLIYAYSIATSSLISMDSIEFNITDVNNTLFEPESISFTKQFNGFRVDGEIGDNPLESSAELLIVEQLNFIEPWGNIDSIPLHNLKFDNGVFISGLNSDIKFNSEIMGFHFIPGTESGISVESSSGLYLLNMKLEYDISNEEKFEIPLDEIFISSASNSELSCYQSGLSSFDLQSSWNIDDITSISLFGDALVLKNGHIDFSNYTNLRVLDFYDVGSRDIVVSDCFIDADRSFISGKINSEFKLSLGYGDDKIDIHVTSAKLVEDQLIIERGTLLLDDSYSVYDNNGNIIDIVITDLHIDQNGLVTKDPFVLNPFYIKHSEDFEFCIESLHFTTNGYSSNGYVLSSKVKVSGSDFSDFKMTNRGITEDSVGLISEDFLFKTLSGFSLYSSAVNVKITSEGYLLESATIDLTAFEQGLNATVINTLVNFDNNKILVPGTSKPGDSYEINHKPYFYQSDKYFILSNLEINNEHLVAKKSTIPLPTLFDSESIILTDMVLTIDSVTNKGSFEKCNISSDIKVLKLNNRYDIEFDNGFYEDGSLHFTNAFITLPIGSNIEKLELDNLKIDYDNVIYDPFPNFIFTDNGFKFNIYNPFLTEIGIKSDSILECLINGELQQLNLDEFTLIYDGSYTIPKTINNRSSINIAEFNAVVEGITFDNETSDNIYIDEVTIGKRDDSVKFKLQDLTINRSGDIIDIGSYIRPGIFTSSNGFIVDGESIIIKDNRILLNGEIYLPDFMNSLEPIVITDYSMEIDANWNILTRGELPTHTININGLDILIDNHYITENGIFIGESFVVLENNKNLVINNSVFSCDNKVIQPGSIEIPNNSYNIGGWQMVVSDAFFSENGIELESHVMLPEAFGSTSLYFNDMTLYQESSGITFKTDVTVNSLEFSIKDINFYFGKIKFSQDELSIRNCDITLPDNEIFNGEIISLKYFKIGKGGSFKLSGSNVNPIKIKGFDIYIRDLSFIDNLLNIEGSMQFPTDFVISELAGKTVSIKTLQYNMTTEELTFDIELDKITIEITEGWTTEISSLSVSDSKIKIGEGIVHFPTKWLDNISVEDCRFNNLSFDISTGEFEIEEIFIDNIEVDCEGYQFSISSVSYSSSEGFSLSGEFPLNGLFKGEEESPVIIVHNLQIQDDFTLIQLEAGLQADKLLLTKDGELIYSGYIGIEFSDNEFIITMDGYLEAGDNFGLEDLRGDQIDIEEFRFSILDNEILMLKAHYSATSKTFLDTEIRDFIFELDYTKESTAIDFCLGGDLILSDSFPGIGGEIFTLYGEFDSKGNINELTSSLSIDADRPLVGDLILKSGSSISLNPIINVDGEYSQLAGIEFILTDTEVEFSENFSVEMLRGGSIDIEELIISSDAGFKSCDLSYNTPVNMEIYSGIYLIDGNISLTSFDNKDINTSLSGKIKLPENLGGITINIKEFNVDTDGIITIDGGATNISANLLDQLELSNGNISVNNGSGRGTLDFYISGDFKFLNKNIPEEIQNIDMFGEVLFSTDTGIDSFYIGMLSDDPINYELINGVNISLNGLSISELGFSSSVSLNISNGFYGIEGETKTTGSIFMNWNGEITESDLTIEKLELKYAGMGCYISDMTINEDGINFENAIIHLPETLGSQEVGISNGGISSTGEFYGDFAIEVLNIDMLGCYISMVEPEFDKELEEIRCSSAEFILPEALGSASVGLTDVSIGSGGLSISGGSFLLPDIDTGAMKFSNMGATLIISGDEYEIGATGKVFIAGMGEIEAKISLVNLVKPEYPIGLKYAYFSFETEIGGIPLANTGLLLTGVRGGLAFGPPGDDLPEYLRDKFSDGMRIQLGVTIKDISMTITGRSDFWLNVTNFDFALKGEMEFLNGLFTSSASALYTQTYGMELLAGLEISLIDKIILDGLLRAHIFEESDKTRFCAEATVELSVKDLLYGFPEEPISLGSVGVEIGDFKDDKKGVKGYITLNIIGTKGFYYGTNGDFKLGNCDSYTLLDKSLNVSKSSSLITSKIDKNFRMVPTQNIKNNSNRERIIFCLEFSEGDPMISAVSPSGLKYSEGDENVIVERIDNKILMAVVNPEDGDWDLLVDNLTKDSEYNIEAIGFGKNAEINLENPKASKESSSDSFKVEGSYKVHTSDATITIYCSREKGAHNGKEVISFKPEDSSTFKTDIDTLSMDNGEYYLYAGIYDGINPELYSYAPGSIIVNNNLDDLPNITDLIAGVSDDSVVNISFTNSLGNSVKGYYINSYDQVTGESNNINIGNMTKLSLSSFNEAHSYSISVIPYDNSGLTGQESNRVEIDFNNSVHVENSFNISMEDIVLEIGTGTEADLKVTPKDFTLSGDSNEFVELIITDKPDFITCQLTNNRVQLDKENSFKMTLLCNEPEELNKELYFLTLVVRNIGNNKIYRDIEVPIRIKYENPKINNIYPDEWLIERGSQVELKGSGFTQKTTALIDNIPCVITYQNSTTLKVNIPGIDGESEGIIKTYNPDSKVGIYKPKLIRPYYEIKQITDHTVIHRGGTGWLYSEVKNYNGFNDNVNFSLLEYPLGWNITISEFIMEIFVPEETEIGNYNIKVQSGDITTLYKVEVVDDYPNPTIVNLSSYSGNVEEIITIYGYGFNDSSEVYYSGAQLIKISQKMDTIQFLVPNKSSDGIINVSSNGISSNSAQFEIKNNNFNIYPSKNKYQLLPGNSVQQKIQVRGYANYVNLTAHSDHNDITTILDNSSIVPNGSVILTINVGPQVKTGSYKVTINGEGYINNKSEVIIISVGENISFTNKMLKTAQLDSRYSDFIKVENAINSYDFELLKGSYLPNGLTLDNSTGEIYGTPSVSGYYSFFIKVKETQYRYSEKEFILNIEDNGWFTKDSPIGNNRFNNVLSPGEDSVSWISDEFEGINYLLSAKDNVFAISNNRIDVIDKLSGKSDFILTGEFLEVCLKESYILTLENGSLVLYDMVTGLEISNYIGVTDFSSGLNTYIDRSGEVFNINLNNKGYEEKTSNSIFDSNVITTTDGFYRIESNIVKEFKDGHFIEILKIDNPISFFTTFSNEMFLLDNYGTYTGVSDNQIINTGIVDGKIIVGSDFSIVYNSNNMMLINRENMNIIKKSLQINEMILTKDKFVILNSEGVSSYNLYTGEPIWSLVGDYRSLISSSTKLFVINSLNQVLCLGGRDNILAPKSDLVLSPSEPNGLNKYYTVQPELNLTSTDKESYGKTLFNTDDKGWTTFDKPRVFKDGDYLIKYRSVDSEGLTEIEQELSLKVDSTNPQTVMIKHDYIKSITYELHATDKTSQVLNTYYEVNGVKSIYSKPITIDKEGAYTVSWWSEDCAGNIEEKNSDYIYMDLYDPTINLEVYTKDEIIRVSLLASDSFSGIDKIEYKIDNDRVKRYIKTIELNTNKQYEISYRALDQSGKYSLWEHYIIEPETHGNHLVLTTDRVDRPNEIPEVNIITEEIVDMTKPETTMTKVEIEGGLEIILTSKNDIFYSLNDEVFIYTDPIIINKEASYILNYWSQDSVGNIEDQKSISFDLDLYKPVVSFTTDDKDRVILSATDSFIGIENIEYRINGSTVRQYTLPINLGLNNYYNITFRATDKVGHKSEWKNIVIDKSNPEENVMILNIVGASIIDVEDLKYPDYFKDGIFIKRDNKINKASFKTGMIIDLYLINNINSALPDSSWGLVESNYNGKNIYHKISGIDQVVNIKESEQLIVTKKNSKEDLVIFSPGINNPNWFAATELSDEVTRRWYYKIDNQDWITIAEIFSGELILPVVEDDSSLELKVEVEVKNPVSINKIDLVTRVKKIR